MTNNSKECFSLMLNDFLRCSLALGKSIVRQDDKFSFTSIHFMQNCMY